MLAWQSGTRCQMNLEILTASIVLHGFWKQSSLAATSVTSALEVIFNEMHHINLRFTYFSYLLTYKLTTAIQTKREGKRQLQTTTATDQLNIGQKQQQLHSSITYRVTT